MSMGDESQHIHRPRWRDDPSVGRDARPSETPSSERGPDADTKAAAGGALDIARDSDVPISTQLYWQLAYQIDTGRLHPGSRLPTVRELGAILHVNPNTVRAVYRRLAEAGYVVVAPGGRHPGHGPGAAAPDLGCARGPRGGAAPLGGPLRLLRGRGRLGRLRRRHPAQAPGSPRQHPVRRVHGRRRPAGRGADRRHVRRPGRGGRRADRPDERAAGPLPLRPRRHVHVPRRRDDRARGRARPGHRDACRPVVRGDARRGSGAARGKHRRARLCHRAEHPEHRPVAARVRRRGGRAADRAPGRRARARPRRPDRRPAAPDPRSPRDRAGRTVRPPRADPGMDLRPGPGRPRAAPACDRPDQGRPRARRGGRREAARCRRPAEPVCRPGGRRARAWPDPVVQPRRIRRRAGIGGEPWASTARRCSP